MPDDEIELTDFERFHDVVQRYTLEVDSKEVVTVDLLRSFIEDALGHTFVRTY